MPRFFVEVFYKGTNYAGFQVQKNANSIQAEIEKALSVYLRAKIECTGSSRTDAGVHALQNYFHFDTDIQDSHNWPREIYHVNAILPPDIVVRSIFQVEDHAHCRFDAVSRTYEYRIYQSKNPFLQDRAFYFPYRLNKEALNEAASIIRATKNFQSFSKRNTQVKTYICEIFTSEWFTGEDQIVYRVTGNRFLRGMVRGLTGTMLKVGTGKLTIPAFENIIASGNPALVDFSVEPQGLTLVSVNY
jgi:tRNA pseudouridine38-40 synthase